MRLERITGCVIDLFARVVDPALAVHAVLVDLEGQDQLAVRTRAAILFRVVTHAPTPFDPVRQVTIQRFNQSAISRIGAPTEFGKNSTLRFFRR